MKIVGKFIRFIQRIICIPFNRLKINLLWGGGMEYEVVSSRLC